LIESGDLVRDDFAGVMEKIRIIDKSTYDTVWEAFDEFFKGNYYQFVCVLVLQLEDILRKLLVNIEVESTVLDSNGFREKTLGSILSELKPHLSEPIYYYFSWVMEDYRGMNLRNNIAHGLFKKDNINPLHAVALIHLYCLLFTNIQLVEK
jgi:hypothetical protein